MAQVSAHRYEIPLVEPFRVAVGTVDRARNLLVVARDGGRAGYGEAAPFPPVTGETPKEVEARLAAWLGSRAAWNARGGHLGIAAGLAVDVALVDLAARQAEVPLCTHLGGAPPGSVLTSITIPLMEPAAAAARAKVHRAAGFRAFKVKAGAGVAEDLERIRRVREVVGSAELRVDANQGWSREEALGLLPSLVDLGVSVLEQPLHRSDLAGHASLRGHGVPIMLDESVFDVEDARRAIRVGACDRINIKLQKVGSVDGALRIAALAAASGVPCMVGCMIESRVGILAAAHVARAHANIEWADLDGHTFLALDPVHGGARIEDGSLRLAASAGLGIADVAAGEQIVAPVGVRTLS